METKKLRFQDAHVGDEVYCRLRGEGIIKSITYSDRYPLECLFCDNCTPFDYDGRSQKDHFEPTLFYRKGSEKYLTERPETDVDWTKIPEGTQVIPFDEKEPRTDNNENYHESFMAYLPHLEYPFWVYYENGGRKDYARGFKYCKLAEPCKPEWRK